MTVLSFDRLENALPLVARVSLSFYSGLLLDLSRLSRPWLGDGPGLQLSSAGTEGGFSVARGWQELSLRCPVPPVWCNHLFVLGTGVTCAVG